MLNGTQKFIEQNIDLIQNNDFRTLFTIAYTECLMTSEMRELHDVLLESGIFDSTQLRNDLLFDFIKSNLDHAKTQDKTSSFNSLAVQFLRYYLNNTFGFYEGEAVVFMRDNAKELGIQLIPTERAPGQSSIDNYYIIYDN